MFNITSNKGFHITFENGYTVSVQFGWGNYCDNYDERPESCKMCGISKCPNPSSTAECAVWGKDGELIQRPGWDNGVSNRSTPAEVLELLNWAANQSPVLDDERGAAIEDE